MSERQVHIIDPFNQMCLRCGRSVIDIDENGKRYCDKPLEYRETLLLSPTLRWVKTLRE